MPNKTTTPKFTHSGKTTKVFYPNHNTSNSNTNRPAQVKRTSSGTTCIYRNK